MIKFRIGLTVILLTGLFFNSCNQHIAQKKEETQTLYTCPMHKDYISYQPGKCPKCGMTLNILDLDNMQRRSSESPHGGSSGSGSSGGHHH